MSEVNFHNKINAFDGGRTRARTLDPLIKSPMWGLKSLEKIPEPVKKSATMNQWVSGNLQTALDHNAVCDLPLFLTVFPGRNGVVIAGKGK
jgi:hypothetical protein